MGDIFRRRGRAEEDKEGKIMRYEFLDTLQNFSNANIERQKSLYGVFETIGEAVILSHYETLPSLAAAQKEGNNAIEQLTEKLDALTAKVDSIGREIIRQNAVAASLAAKMDVFERNLMDLRQLHGRIADGMGGLKTDAIDDFLMKPLMKELVTIYEDLRGKQGDGNSAEIKASMEQFRVMLENYDVEIIEPNERNKFNPSEHTPVKKYGVASKYLDRTVKNTVCTGIKYKGKVIKPALVEVLYFKPEKHKEGSNGAEEKSEAGTE